MEKRIHFRHYSNGLLFEYAREARQKILGYNLDILIFQHRNLTISIFYDVEIILFRYYFIDIEIIYLVELKVVFTRENVPKGWNFIKITDTKWGFIRGKRVTCAIFLEFMFTKRCFLRGKRAEGARKFWGFRGIYFIFWY